LEPSQAGKTPFYSQPDLSPRQSWLTGDRGTCSALDLGDPFFIAAFGMRRGTKAVEAIVFRQIGLLN